MKKTAKDTLMSVVVLFAIAFVCVGLLAVANEYLKYEAKLDEAMAKQLYVVCPTGQPDDSDAINYFEILSADDTIEKVNSEFGTPTTYVLAAFRATKGDNAGCYIVQARAECSYGEVVMLTSYDKSGKIMKTICYSQNQSFWDSKIAGKYDGFENLVGKDGDITGSDIATGTGATFSIQTVADSVTISNKMAAELIGGNV